MTGALRHLVAAAAMLAAAPAAAQAYSCAVPGAIPRPRPDLPSAREPRRVLPVGSYTLALSWSPQYCRTSGDRPDARFQCASGNRFGFTLHGLWPDGVGRDWPQYCAAAPILSRDLIRRNLCMTPSAQLLQHEYAKHGTCMGVSPTRYFAQARRLHARIRYPDMAALSRRAGLTAGQFAAAFARANRGLTADMMRITADRRGWLSEVWLCLDRRFVAVRCPAHQQGLARSAPLRIWRV